MAAAPAVVPAKKESYSMDWIPNKMDWGHGNSIRFSILTLVTEGQYEKAVRDLDEFVNMKSEFPTFKPKIEKYINHSIDLVHAIKAKRNFPGREFLRLAKQQELSDRFKNHFDELNTTLKKVERIHEDLKFDDLRSTVWIVRAICQSVSALFIAVTLIDLSQGFFQNSMAVLDDTFTNMVNTMFNYLNW